MRNMLEIRWLGASSGTGCLQENGTTSGVYLGNCSTTASSDLWYRQSSFDIWANGHSHLCLIITGSDAGVWLTGPAGNCPVATVDSHKS